VRLGNSLPLFLAISQRPGHHDPAIPDELSLPNSHLTRAILQLAPIRHSALVEKELLSLSATLNTGQKGHKRRVGCCIIHATYQADLCAPP
jgi:hypothetical protein